MKYEDITEKIIGYAMRVHSFLGNGYMEVFYQRALALEFRNNGVRYKREVEIPIYYRDFPEPIGKRRADFVVQDVVLVETKATTKLDDAAYAQVLNYLRAYRMEVGLLLNFGETSLKFKRFVNTIK